MIRRTILLTKTSKTQTADNRRNCLKAQSTAHPQNEYRSIGLRIAVTNSEAIDRATMGHCLPTIEQDILRDELAEILKWEANP